MTTFTTIATRERYFTHAERSAQSVSFGAAMRHARDNRPGRYDDPTYVIKDVAHIMRHEIRHAHTIGLLDTYGITREQIADLTIKMIVSAPSFIHAIMEAFTVQATNADAAVKTRQNIRRPQRLESGMRPTPLHILIMQDIYCV